VRKIETRGWRFRFWSVIAMNGPPWEEQQQNYDAAVNEERD
jgi:hypothetical protein